MNSAEPSVALKTVLSVTLVLAFTGCGTANLAFPNTTTQAPTSQTATGQIQGSVYGGHAPIVGAHVYLLQANNSSYGGQATSILNTGPGNAGLAQNVSDPGVPASWYYTITAVNGIFNLNGDYTCTSGLPVYLYAYGGNPSYPAASPASTTNTFNIGGANGTAGTASETAQGAGVVQYTFTVAASNAAGVSGPPELFYIGEPVTFSGLGTAITLTSGTVLATGLTTTTFTVTGMDTYNAGTRSVAVAAGATVTGAPVNNPAIVNMAMVGICPSSGNFSTGGTVSLADGTSSSFSPISFIWMNEVSTAALAYAMEGFTSSTATAGYGTYIGAPSTNMVGLQHAANNAGLLYDILGSNVSTTYAGEGHIARSVTPNGNGNVPQAVIDTLGNILAACVDSNNTSTVNGSAGESPQCQVLFQTATSNGIPYGHTGAGTVPVDTAQAAFYIAENPAGNANYTATWMNSLYVLPAGNVPFAPYLTTQPTDFGVAIQYLSTNNPQVVGAESVAIDGNGNVWINSLTKGPVYEINPQGVLIYTTPTPASGTVYRYVTVDIYGNIWVSQSTSPKGETEIVTSTTPYTINTYLGPWSGGFYLGIYPVAGTQGNIYVEAVQNSLIDYSITNNYILGFSNAGANLANFPINDNLAPYNGLGYELGHGAVDNASAGGYIWYTAEASGAVVRIDPTTGAEAPGFPSLGYGSGGTQGFTYPENPAIDRSGYLWLASQSGSYAGTIASVQPTAAANTTYYAGHATNYYGGLNTGQLNTPFGTIIDGAQNLFIANRGGSGSGSNSIAEFSIPSLTNISPPTTYFTLNGQLSEPLNLAIDQAGTLWITGYDSNTMTQWIGAGAPTYNPLSKAASVNALATKP